MTSNTDSHAIKKIWVEPAVGMRPFAAMARFVHPLVAWAWALATLLSSFVFHASQYALAAGVIEDDHNRIFISVLVKIGMERPAENGGRDPGRRTRGGRCAETPLDQGHGPILDDIDGIQGIGTR